MPNYLDTSTKVDAISSAAKVKTFRPGNSAVGKIPGNSNSTESGSVGNFSNYVDSPDEFGASESDIRWSLRGQDFYELKKRHCLQNLFVDPEFPANNSSIGPEDFICKMKYGEVLWRRPRDILDDPPKLFVNGSSRFDVVQKNLGDCWFLSALSALGDRPDLLSQVVPQCRPYRFECDEDSCGRPDCRVFDDDNYAGIFYFRFWQEDSWVEVVIDDRLPTTIHGQLIFAKESTENEFWGALVEKAYAKLKGSYEGLHYGFSSRALTDLTGKECFSYYFDNKGFNLENILSEAQTRNALIVLSTTTGNDGFDANSEERSILQSHAYSLTKYFIADSTKTPWVMLRNPSGSGEWKGVGSDRWIKENLPKDYQGFNEVVDGEFFMKCDDATFFFKHVDVCYVDSVPPSDDTNHITWTKEWYVKAKNGEWVPGQTAGGPYNDEEESTFSTNPRYRVTLSGRYLRKHQVTVGLRQNAPQTNEVLLSTGFDIFQVHSDRSERRYIATKFDANEAKQMIQLRLNLGDGTYEIVPFTAEPGQSRKFTLRVACHRTDRRYRINEFELKDPSEILAETSLAKLI